MAENNLLLETLYWGLSIILSKSKDDFNKLNFSNIAQDIINCTQKSVFWTNVSVEKNSLEWYSFRQEAIIIGRFIIDMFSLLTISLKLRVLIFLHI